MEVRPGIRGRTFGRSFASVANSYRAEGSLPQAAESVGPAESCRLEDPRFDSRCSPRVVRDALAFAVGTSGSDEIVLHDFQIHATVAGTC